MRTHVDISTGYTTLCRPTLFCFCSYVCRLVCAHMQAPLRSDGVWYVASSAQIAMSYLYLACLAARTVCVEHTEDETHKARVQHLIHRLRAAYDTTRPCMVAKHTMTVQATYCVQWVSGYESGGADVCSCAPAS